MRTVNVSFHCNEYAKRLIEGFMHMLQRIGSPMPAEVRAKLEDLRRRMTQQRNGVDITWAERLRDREQAGERLTQAQREAWRIALRQPAEPEDNGAFSDEDVARTEALKARQAELLRRHERRVASEFA